MGRRRGVCQETLKFKTLCSGKGDYSAHLLLYVKTAPGVHLCGQVGGPADASSWGTRGTGNSSQCVHFSDRTRDSGWRSLNTGEGGSKETSQITVSRNSTCSRVQRHISLPEQGTR